MPAIRGAQIDRAVTLSTTAPFSSTHAIRLRGVEADREIRVNRWYNVLYEARFAIRDAGEARALWAAVVDSVAGAIPAGWRADRRGTNAPAEGGAYRSITTRVARRPGST